MEDSQPQSLNDAEVARLKIPPHSIEAEQSVLGGLLLSGDSWERVADIITAVDFYRSEHRLMFQVMEKLVENEQPLDLHTVADALADLKELQRVGGIAYIAEIAHNTPSASNIRAYATIVRERAILRQLIGAAATIVDSGYFTEGRSSADILEDAERQILQIAEGRTKGGGPQWVTPILKTTLDRLDELCQSDSSLTGLSTGFSKLDEKTSGLQSSDLIIVAARPSMGKTSFAMNLVENVITSSNTKPVVVFSMEMPAEALTMRMLSSIGKIDQNRVRTGDLKGDDWTKLSAAVGKLKDKPLFIDDTPALTPTEVRSRTRRLMREHGEIGMVMIDYLQLMQIAGSSEGRTAEISEISRSLKSLAKEFNCPVIALSQLNRAVEQRPNRRPVMSDLRESGAIEQDADVIMFIYRDEVYNEDTPDKGVAEINIGKQRNGPIGMCKLAFFGQYTRFENLAFGDYPEME